MRLHRHRQVCLTQEAGFGSLVKYSKHITKIYIYIYIYVYMYVWVYIYSFHIDICMLLVQIHMLSVYLYGCIYVVKLYIYIYMFANLLIALWCICTVLCTCLPGTGASSPAQARIVSRKDVSRRQGCLSQEAIGNWQYTFAFQTNLYFCFQLFLLHLVVWVGFGSFLLS